MNRRNFFAAAAAGVTASRLAAAPAHKAIIELTFIRMRNNKDNQMARSRNFVGQSVKPALKRAGSGPIGIFSNLIGPDSPSLLMVTTYPSLVDMEIISNKLAEDEQFANEVETFNQLPGLAFQRIEKRLLQGFDTMPGVEVAPRAGKGPRVFELRIYESNTFLTLKKKMGMFDSGEIDIFRKSGLQPVFFGETLIGPRMPNLTYMVGFENWADREKAWTRFGKSPEWRKLRATPGLSDAEIVSNISNFLYRPLPGSDIR